jgi:hypothetical protein
MLMERVVYLQSCVTSALRGVSGQVHVPADVLARKEPRFALSNWGTWRKYVRKSYYVTSMSWTQEVSHMWACVFLLLLQHRDTLERIIRPPATSEPIGHGSDKTPVLSYCCHVVNSKSAYPNRTAVMLTGRLLKSRLVVPSLTIA